MINRRRTAIKTSLSLEALDARVVPSALGLSTAGHVGATIHVAAHPHAHHATAKPVHHAAVHTKAAAHAKAAAHGKAAALHTFGGGFSFPMSFAFTSGTGAALMVPSSSIPAATTSTTSNTPVSATDSSAASATPAAASVSATPAVSAAPSSSTAGTAASTTTASTAATSATTTSFGTQISGPLAKAGAELAELYQSFSAGGTVPADLSYLQISGSSVNVDIQGSGDFAAFENALTSLGFQVKSTDPQREIVEGLLPINQILAAAQLSQTVGMHPVYNPGLR